jgi:hypothetical protein
MAVKSFVTLGQGLTLLAEACPRIEKNLEKRASLFFRSISNDEKSFETLTPATYVIRSFTTVIYSITQQAVISTLYMLR